MSSRSRKKIQQAEGIIVSGIAVLVLSTAPELILLQLGGMVVDIIDAYDYGSTLTRQATDTHAQIAFKDIREKESSDVVKAAVKQHTDTLNITEEEKQDLLERSTSHWAEYNPTPRDYEKCFDDFVNIKEGARSLSGKPSLECENTYKVAYEKFITDNEQEYIEKQIIGGKRYVNMLNDLLIAGLRIENLKKRNTYRDTSIIFGFIILLPIIGVLLAYVILK